MNIKKSGIYLSSLVFTSSLFIGCGAPPEPWKQAGFTGKKHNCGVDWECWENSGFSPKEAKEWKNLNIHRTNAIEFKQNGYTLKNIKQWHNHGITSIHKIKRIKAIGIEIEEYKQFSKIGFSSLDDLKDIKRYNLELKDLTKYHTIKFKHNENWKFKIFSLLKKYNISLNEAKKFNQNNFFLEYRRLDHYLFELWSEDKFNAKDSKIWRDAGFKPSLTYRKMDRNSAIGNAKKWHDNGYTVKQAKHLKELRINKNKYFASKDFRKKLNSYDKYNLDGIKMYNKMIDKINRTYPYYIQATKINFTNGKNSTKFYKNEAIYTISTKIGKAMIGQTKKGISYYNNLAKRYEKNSFYGIETSEEYREIHAISDKINEFTKKRFPMENSIIPLTTKNSKILTDKKKIRKLDRNHKINIKVDDYIFGEHLFDIESEKRDKHYIKNVEFTVFSLKGKKIKQFTISPEDKYVDLKINY